METFENFPDSFVATKPDVLNKMMGELPTLLLATKPGFFLLENLGDFPASAVATKIRYVLGYIKRFFPAAFSGDNT